MTTRRDIPFGRPWITDAERNAVDEVLRGHILTHGPQCKSFEAEFAAFMGPDAHAVSVSSCMAALHLAYLHLGLTIGDEVIVPAMTHTATAHAVEWTGARSVFVDCDPMTGNVTAAAIEAAITAKTRAISLVHFLGIPCDMPAIVALADKHGLKVVEDCALAVGSRWDGRHVGLFGDIGCFSFYPVKHITTGEGGMFVTRHADVAASVARLRAFGVDRTHSERSIPGMYEVPSLGLNYRMSEVQAAIGRVQIGRVGGNLEGRAARFAALKAGIRQLPGVHVLDAVSAPAVNSHYCLSVVIDGAAAGRRNAIVEKLNAAGVGTSVYYPHPVPRLQYYRAKYGYDAAAFTHAETISDASIALPVSWHIAPDDVDYIVESFAQALQETRV